MKKTFNSILICCIMALVLTLSLAACNKSCDHVYDDCADIECNLCGEARDSMHTWVNADCDSPKTCSVCGKTEGSALGHTPNEDDGDCTTEIKCKDCGKATTAAKASHTPKADDGDCTTAVICKDCGTITTPARAHIPNADDDDCTTDITCKACGKVTTAGYREHTPKADDGDCTTPIDCSICGTIITSAIDGHSAEPDDHDCTTATKCVTCEKVLVEAKEHTGGTATCGAKAACEHCGTAYGELDPNNHDLTTVDNNGVCECGQPLTFVITNSGVNANYDNLEDALAAWTDNTTLTLFSDVLGLTEYIKTFAKGLILDLNGHKIECSHTLCTIWIEGDSSSELTIRDGKGGGYIQGSVYAVSSRKGLSTLRLESGTVETVSANGDFTMTGGCIAGDDFFGLGINSEVEVIIDGGEIYGGRYGILNYCGNLTVSGTAKITATSGCAIDSNVDGSVVVSGTPTISGGTCEFTLGAKITLNTQPAYGEVWRVKIDSYIEDGIFAIPGEGVTLDMSKFASAKDGYDLRMNAKGELLLCNHSVSYYGVSNGNGTHNMTCWCGGTVLETDLACSGGMATDTLLSSCQYCGAAYGELDPNVHYDIYTENMAEEELQAALAELLSAGQTEISIYLADADTKMLTAIYAALNSSNVDKDSVKLKFGSQNTVQNENEMLTALKKGGIIILTADIALPPQEDVRENTIIILNGYSLTPGINGLGVEGGCTLTVIGDGNVNGDDGLWVFEGTLDMQSGTVEAMYVCETVSTANIYGGKITFLAVDYGSTANIFDGEITSLTVDEDSTVNISGGYVGELDYYEGTLIITGGSFGFDPTAYVDTSNYTVTEADGIWTVTQNN